MKRIRVHTHPYIADKYALIIGDTAVVVSLEEIEKIFDLLGMIVVDSLDLADWDAGAL